MDIDVERLKWDADYWDECNAYISDFMKSNHALVCGIPRPTKSAAPEWDGDYPSAGTWVEGKRNSTDWIECLFIGLDDKNNPWFKTYQNVGDLAFSVFSSTMKIRPIRTQADRDRDELISIIGKGWSHDQVKACADAIIAAGYRKEK